MAGLRERKKRATRGAIRDAAMRLFAEHGFAGTTIDQIAEAANVSRATVFTYFPTKEEIVFGEGGAVIDALAVRLRERPGHEPTIAIVRAWLDELTGWFEPELVLQQRLARDTFAASAIWSIVVPAKPCSANSRMAASRIAPRVARFLRSRSPATRRT